jgi:hypothetical protein
MTLLESQMLSSTLDMSVDSTTHDDDKTHGNANIVAETPANHARTRNSVGGAGENVDSEQTSPSCLQIGKCALGRLAEHENGVMVVETPFKKSHETPDTFSSPPSIQGQVVSFHHPNDEDEIINTWFQAQAQSLLLESPPITQSAQKGKISDKLSNFINPSHASCAADADNTQHAHSAAASLCEDTDLRPTRSSAPLFTFPALQAALTFLSTHSLQVGPCPLHHTACSQAQTSLF